MPAPGFSASARSTATAIASFSVEAAGKRAPRVPGGAAPGARGPGRRLPLVPRKPRASERTVRASAGSSTAPAGRGAALRGRPRQARRRAVERRPSVVDGRDARHVESPNGRSTWSENRRPRSGRSASDAGADAHDHAPRAGRRRARSRARRRPRAARARRSPAEGAAGAASTRCPSARLRSFARMPILAHLDLDAFFAAVEELEQPELRRRPLVVGGDPRGRGVVSTANYVARRFGIRSAMSCAEALRRCPQAVFLRPRHCALPRVLAGRVDGGARGRAARRAHRDWTRATSTSRALAARLRPRPGVRRGGADLRARRRRASRARSASRPRRSSPRSRPTGASRAGSRSCRPAPRRRSWRRSRCARCRASGRAPRRGCARPGDATVGALAALADLDLRAVLPGQVGRLLRDRARGIDPRGLETCRRAHLDLGRGDLRARPRRPGRCSTPSCGGWPPSSAGRLQRDGLAARTVTAKLRYADFSIRCRSTSLPAGIDDAGPDRRARLRASRPRPARPAGRAPARRRRRLRPLRPPPADARGDGLGEVARARRAGELRRGRRPSCPRPTRGRVGTAPRAAPRRSRGRRSAPPRGAA